MSHILFMRLAGPMQSWGVMSRFSRRDTGKEPSRSGVIGLICAAMGIDRADDGHPDLAKLSRAKLGIRVLRGGVLQSDYHTAQDVAIANTDRRKDGTYKTKDTELSTRFYLADADFIAAVQSDDRDLLERVHAALKRPVWQLFLGRKAFVPSMPIYLKDDVAIAENTDLSSVLKDAVLPERLGISISEKRLDIHQRVVIEVDNVTNTETVSGSEIRQDVPLSFAKRRFTVRRVHTTFAEKKEGGDTNGTLS